MGNMVYSLYTMGNAGIAGFITSSVEPETWVQIGSNIYSTHTQRGIPLPRNKKSRGNSSEEHPKTRSPKTPNPG